MQTKEQFEEKLTSNDFIVRNKRWYGNDLLVSVYFPMNPVDVYAVAYLTDPSDPVRLGNATDLRMARFFFVASAVDWYFGEVGKDPEHPFLKERPLAVPGMHGADLDYLVKQLLKIQKTRK